MKYARLLLDWVFPAKFPPSTNKQMETLLKQSGIKRHQYDNER